MATADQIEKAKERLQDRYDQKQAALKALHQKAVKDCEAILAMIVKRYKPTQVYQWGSLLNPGHFREYSDSIRQEGKIVYERQTTAPDNQNRNRNV